MADYRYFKEDDVFVVERWNGVEWEHSASVDSEDVAIDMVKHSCTLQGLRELALDLGFSYSFVERFLDTVDTHNGFISDHDYYNCVEYLMQSADGLM